MRRFLILTAVLLTSSALAAAPGTVSELVVAYPPANYRVPYDHVIFEGHVSPGATLSINGRPLNVGADGLFMEWLPLQPGKNALKLLSTLNGQRRAVTFKVTYAVPRALPAKPTAIAPGTLTPDRPLTLLTRVPAEARRLTVRFQGSPEGKASVTVPGWNTFSMAEQPASTRPPQAAGWYQTTLTLPENLPLGAAPLRVSLKGRDGQTVIATAAGKLTSNPVGAARVAEVTADEVGQGVNPSTSAFATGAATTDLLFPKVGQRVRVLGDNGEDYLLAGPGGLAYGFKDALTLLPAGTPLPAAGVGLPRLEDAPGEWQIHLPISQRTPFSLDETAGTGAALTLRLADASLPAGNLPATFSTPGLSWQPQGTAFKLDIALPQKQNWGYFAAYDSGQLVLHVRKAPALGTAQPLKGRVILLDPGHGGSELGGAGSLGQPEKNIVLPVALRVAELLRSLGADARLTRTADVRVPLYDRPLLAENLKADLLVSIHANALPDGYDPRARRGLEVYTFHPMTWGLARNLISNLTRNAPELQIRSVSGLEPPGLRLGNLALTRPSSQRSVLIEMAYLTQKDDLRLLMSAAGREQLAQGIAQGIAADYVAQAKQTPAWALPSVPEPLPAPVVPPPTAPELPVPTPVPPTPEPLPPPIMVPAAPLSSPDSQP
ncbi:N-acetylmuramoyl-L-alanine amidase family protein [Deinococcus sp.]|uniref:N-acetylmuramoyl-L-alanine amidase family protein n=1 Tax=Deinococcus sp. TaxID=47478 RepID=UPI003B58F3BE